MDAGARARARNQLLTRQKYSLWRGGVGMNRNAVRSSGCNSRTFINSLLGRKPCPSGRGGSPAALRLETESENIERRSATERRAVARNGELCFMGLLFSQTKVWFFLCGVTRGSNFGF